MQTLHTNPTVVRFDFDYKKASEVAKKAHVVQTLHTNPTVVRFDFYYKKASEVTTNAQEELESGSPPLFSNESNIYSFTHSLTHSLQRQSSLPVQPEHSQRGCTGGVGKCTTPSFFERE